MDTIDIPEPISESEMRGGEDFSSSASAIFVFFAMLYRLDLSLWLWWRSDWFFAISADEVERALLSVDCWHQPTLFPALWWPPLPIWLGGLITGAGVPPSVALSLFSLFCSVLTIPIFYFLLRRSLDTGAAVIGVWLLACQPELIWLGISGLAESPLLLFMTCAVAAAVAFWTRGGIPALLLSSLFLCAATATRYESWIVFPLLLAGLLLGIFTDKRRGIFMKGLLSILTICISSVFVAAWCFHQYRSHGHPLAFVQNAAEYLETYFDPSIRLAAKYPKILVQIAPVAAFLAPVGLVLLWCRRESTREFLRKPLVWMVGIFILFFAYQIWSAIRGLIPTHNVFRTVQLPLVFLLIPLAAVALRRMVRGALLPGTVILVFATLLITVPRVKHHPEGIPKEDIKAGLAVAEHLPEEGKILVEIRPWNFNTVRLFSGSPLREQWVYDRGIGFSGMELLNDERNPSVFSRPPSEFAEFIRARNVRLVAAYSEQADDTLNAIDWRPVEHTEEYTIYRPPTLTEND